MSKGKGKEKEGMKPKTRSATKKEARTLEKENWAGGWEENPEQTEVLKSKEVESMTSFVRETKFHPGKRTGPKFDHQASAELDPHLCYQKNPSFTSSDFVNFGVFPTTQTRIELFNQMKGGASPERRLVWSFPPIPHKRDPDPPKLIAPPTIWAAQPSCQRA
jgi:hypothetical protein